jgi:hypothetical protein
MSAPQDPHAVRRLMVADLGVGGNEDEILNKGLTDQHPIERIAVIFEQGKAGDTHRLIGRYVHHVDAAFFRSG